MPSFPVLPVIILLIVLTPISALELLCGNATELRRWWTPQSFRNVAVALAMKTGPPSEAVHLAISGEGLSECIDESLSSVFVSLYDGPIGVAIDNRGS